MQQTLRDEFAKLNTTLSILPGGCTGYVQVLDFSVNRDIKRYIEEYEDEWIDEHFNKWIEGNFSVGDRRILVTKWVGMA